jgi:hypothetical protein
LTEILVVANETLGGRRLREVLAQKTKINPSLVIRLVIPQSRPRRGSVIYVESVHDAAQVRLDLALALLRDAGFEASGEVGDSDPFNATMDAIGERKPDEIVISTLPATASGWLRRDLVERVAEASGIAVQHVISELDEDSLPQTDTTLVVANRTAASPELTRYLIELAQPDSLFIVLVPALGTDGRRGRAGAPRGGPRQAARGRSRGGRPGRRSRPVHRDAERTAVLPRQPRGHLDASRDEVRLAAR